MTLSQTKIIATLGPETSSTTVLKNFAEAGVNIFRLNFSHGTHEWHSNAIRRIKNMNRDFGFNIAIMLDTKGPEIRTGDIKNPRKLKKGDTFTLTINRTTEESDKVQVNYDAFVSDVIVGETILVDGGVISLRVKEKNQQDVICEVLDDGMLTSRRHINLPSREVSLAPITEKDWDDIKLGVDMGVDFIALSFVRDGNEVEALQKYIREKNKNISVVAKIESFEATKYLEKICKVSDGVMIARGDLGAEVPFARVPRLQKEIIHICSQYSTPVIVATQMLESMVINPIPTRAEVTDISHAVWQMADSVMLSGETASGKYPIKSIKTMKSVIVETEKNMKNEDLRVVPVRHNREEIAYKGVQMACDLKNIKAILVITRSGFMAKTVSAFRPRVPIFACTNETSSRRYMQLLFGTTTFRIEFSSTPQKTIQRAREHILKRFPQMKKKQYVLISDFLVEGEMVPTLQIREF